MIHVSLDGEGPLHRQAYRALRAAILEDRLRPGSRLPSSRNLARELGLSRNTILMAFEQLAAEGYASARGGSGTYVADSIPRRSPREFAARESAAVPFDCLSAAARRVVQNIPSGQASWSVPRQHLRFDFRYGEPAYSDLPLETWNRLLGRRARRASVKKLAYQPPGGAVELREALADYLARARGVVSDPENILVVHGSQQAIDLTVRAFVDPDDPVVIEEPRYTGFSFCLEAAGARLIEVPTDEHGMQVERLRHVANAKLVCTTPAHQFPAGGVLSLERRMALLDWAREVGAHVLEDDYDGEFRYDSRPLESLCSLDTTGRVLYSGTASKLLFPALRLGWLVAPEPVARVLRDMQAITDTGSASLEQLVLADFIAEGHLERHVRRMRSRHAARRKALLEAVEEEFGEQVRIVGTGAGIHVLLRFETLSARYVGRLRSACRSRDVGVYPATPYYARPPAKAELLLGYASLDEAEIREGIARLREAVDSLRA